MSRIQFSSIYLCGSTRAQCKRKNNNATLRNYLACDTKMVIRKSKYKNKQYKIEGNSSLHCTPSSLCRTDNPCGTLLPNQSVLQIFLSFLFFSVSSYSIDRHDRQPSCLFLWESETLRSGTLCLGFPQVRACVVCTPLHPQNNRLQVKRLCNMSNTAFLRFWKSWCPLGVSYWFKSWCIKTELNYCDLVRGVFILRVWQMPKLFITNWLINMSILHWAGICFAKCDQCVSAVTKECMSPNSRQK